MKLMVIDGEPGSSNVQLAVTSDGEEEIEKRFCKCIEQPTELSLKGLEPTLKFYQAEHKALVEAIEPLIRIRVLGVVGDMLRDIDPELDYPK